MPLRMILLGVCVIRYGYKVRTFSRINECLGSPQLDALQGNLAVCFLLTQIYIMTNDTFVKSSA